MTDDDLLFLKQIGLRYARLEFGPEEISLDALRAIQERYAKFNIRILSGVHASYRSTKLQLGQPGRDKDIDTYRQFIRNLGKLGSRLRPMTFSPANTYTTCEVERRGYKTQVFDIDDSGSASRSRRLTGSTRRKIWANYTYFMKAVLPVAEEAGVKMALHPDDPPVSKMNGVAKLFTHYDGYARAEKISAGSKNWGLTFCVGTWLEGGSKMGKDVFEMIRDFGKRGKIFEVHFRNVSSPLPRFEETFPTMATWTCIK